MKYLVMVTLILHTLVEAMAATTLIGGPEGIAAAGSGGQWSMHYGFAALAMASLPVWAWPWRAHLPTLTVLLGVMVTFHAGLLISLTLAGDQQVGVVLHSVLLALSAACFVIRRKVAA